MAPPGPQPFVCAYPETANQFSLIIAGDATSQAHLIYKAVDVGGTFSNGGGTSSIVVSSNFGPYTSYAGAVEGSQYFNFKGGVETGPSMSFGHFEELARNIRPGSYPGGFKVFVVTSGSTGEGANGCYEMSQFLGPDAQGEDNGKTLIVFDTEDDICLTKTSSGRQFGPSVLAPFSKVEVMVSQD